jgi:hypothetical protein
MWDWNAPKWNSADSTEYQKLTWLWKKLLLAPEIKYVNYHILYLDSLKWKEQVKVSCDWSINYHARNVIKVIRSIDLLLLKLQY